MFDFIKRNYAENRVDEERVAIVRNEEEGVILNFSPAWMQVIGYVGSLALIISGSTHLKACLAENMIAVSLIVIGSLWIIINILASLHDCQEVFSTKKKVLFWICVLLAVILLCWIFAMNYWSFKMEPDTKSEDHDKPNYCELKFYQGVYWGSIFVVTVLALVFLCLCLCTCEIMCHKD